MGGRKGKREPMCEGRECVRGREGGREKAADEREKESFIRGEESVLRELN